MAGSSRVTGKILLLTLFLSGLGLFFYFGLDRYLSLDQIRDNRDRLLAFTEMHYAVSVALFIGIYCLQTTFSLPGATLLTLTGGFLFGSLPAVLYVNVGATSGATLAFLSARYLFRDWVEARFGKRMASFQEGFSRNGFRYLITFRLIPAIPFFVVNLLSGLTRVKLGTYVVATSIGILPAGFVYTNAGHQIGTINSLEEIASPRVLLAFTFLGLLAVAPILYHRFFPGK
jgi:uncharacterized membrane protein YdjX (TVP38/TMEM64 family)